MTSRRKEYVHQNWLTRESKPQNTGYGPECERSRWKNLSGSPVKQSEKMFDVMQKDASTASGDGTEHHAIAEREASLEVKEKIWSSVEQAAPRSQEVAQVFLSHLGNPDVVIEDIFEDDLSSDSVSEKAPKLLGKKQKKYCTKKMEHFLPFGEKTGFPELVDVSYVINPCHFYVRKYSERKKAHLLTGKLNQFCSGAASCKPDDVLTLGESIMVQSAENGMWCRGSILELIPSDHLNVGRPNGPTQYALHNIAVVQVLMIDYGHFEVFIAARASNHSDTVPVVRSDHVSMPHVIVDDLYRVIIKASDTMPVEIRNVPPLAIKCSLKDIVPEDMNKGWNEEARSEFLRMVNKKSVMMKIFKHDGDKLLVDLMKPPVDKISSDMPVSLRDALVFLELARFSSLSSDFLHQFDRTILKYCPAVLPLAQAVVNASVCHINNPSEFYIQPVDLEFLVLEQKIQEAYKEDIDNLEIICPVLGQACIAQFEDDRWYRARVIGLPGSREVLVMYVDYGNTSTVSVKCIRKIQDNFLCVPEQAVPCQLAFIRPSDSNTGWCTEAIKMLRELTMDQVVKCTVIGVSEDKTLSVELHLSAPIPGKTTSVVNTALVEQGLACFEPHCEKESISTQESIDIWDASLHELLETASPHNISLQSDLNAETMRDLSTSGLAAELSKGVNLEVKVTFVKSPSCIFVQPLSSESLIESLHEKMAAELATTEPELVDWKSDMQCAVLENDTKKWRRGQVLRVASEASVEVLFYDFGYSEVKSACNLRKLSEHFTHGKCAIECSLSEIRPTGGSEKWTATACDFLAHYLTGARVDLVIQEASLEWPLPVKMFCKNEAGQKINMAEYLMLKGLALREKKISSLKHDGQEHKEDAEKSCKESDDRKEIADDKIVLDHRDTAESTVTEKIQVISPVDTCNLADTSIQKFATEKFQVYKPPVIPDSSFIPATVSFVGDDGTIYVIQKSLEVDLAILMDNIQKKFKLQGLLKPYCWKNGDGCAVRGSDTLWYRGKVTEVIGGSVKVFYIDHGYTEKIPPCHLYPLILYEDMPQFCIPCKLHGVVPLGGFWQSDAVELIQELLPKRYVDVKIMEYHGKPLTYLAVEIYFDGMPLSSFMEYNKHCTKSESDSSSLKSEGCNEDTCGDSWEIDFEGLHSPNVGIQPLIHFGLPSLPYPGEFFSVTVKHIETPNEVFISLISREGSRHSSDTDDSGISCVPEEMTLESAMKQLNEYADFLPILTDFASGLPCIAEYVDGLWYRARILAIQCIDPVKVLVQYVDYGSTRLQAADRLRQIPPELFQYPVAAFRVKLAGFKPPRDDGLPDRIPYSPLWSMEALWTMMDCVEGKQLSASLLSGFPEPSAFLYEEEGTLVHVPLIEKSLADVDL
ncbi:RING finger protein 17 isoform X2 [Protopterus annectens]|uniref:RING finger protein 17 isoform X2 n=1 Tax=Protopterus annectens TaxID=7888 RepID=UPI001CFB0DFB|nr:RING finger protein 17 isoform X2 [Protopterus annectens]